jgi:hypothetical protein
MQDTELLNDLPQRLQLKQCSNLNRGFGEQNLHSLPYLALRAFFLAGASLPHRGFLQGYAYPSPTWLR